MKYRLCGPWPVGPWLIPSGTMVDDSLPTGWAAVVAGRSVPLNITPLDAEATAALAAEVARVRRGGV